MVDAADSKSAIGNNVLVQVQSLAMALDLKRFSTFLFDFDGTLVDSEPLHYEAYSEAQKALNLPEAFESFESYIDHAHVKGLPPVSAHPEKAKELRALKVDLYQNKSLKNPPPLMEGAKELLDYLLSSGKKVAVVTNSFRSDISFPYTFKGLVWVTRDLSPEKPKPAPDLYLKALKLLDSTPSESIAFEDARHGLEAAKKAGITAAHISSHFQLDGEPHFFSLRELLSLLRETK